MSEKITSEKCTSFVSKIRKQIFRVFSFNQKSKFSTPPLFQPIQTLNNP